jgi:hypothetical protein
MTHVREYLAKAEEFLLAAASELEAERSSPPPVWRFMPDNAADAVCGARLEERAAGSDHRQTIKLLRRAWNDGSHLAKDLQRLLPLKTTAEYELDDVPMSKASGAVERAKRCVDVARRVIGSL